jgi:Domain of unknown function (DUF4349)
MRPRCALAFVVLALGVGASTGCGKKDDKKGGAPPAVQLAAAPNAEEAPPDKEPQRKIVYKAIVRLIVEDFTESATRLADALKAHKAYIVKSEIRGSPGMPRSGEWKVRVPVDRFEDFQAAVAKLGELQTSNIDSQDVTDEFVDVEARIRNFEKEEASLLEVLQKSTGKLEDVLAVRREVSRVRGDVERAQGRRQLLQNLSDFATLTVFLHERSSYIPEESASFGTILGRTLRGSATALLSFGQGLVVVIVALVPWLLPLAVVGLPVGIWLRRRWARRTAAVRVDPGT